MNKYQENQDWGGKREGAGRPKGSYNRPRFADDLSESDRKQIIVKIIEQAKKGDPTMLKWCGDHLYGKAIQPQEVDITFPDTLLGIIKGAKDE